MYDNRITRRDLLKLAGVLTLSYMFPQVSTAPVQQSSNKENVLIIVFDAFSASNMSLYRYPRKTTPNIDRLADEAIVYHNHFAGGNFTTPGTATLLTGVLPWTHRAIGFNDVVAKTYTHKSIFHAFDTYHPLAFSHNLLANTLLKDFFTGMEGLTPREKLYLQGDKFINTLFSADDDISTVGWQRAFNRQLDGTTYSLFLSRIYEFYKNQGFQNIQKDFPRGLPSLAGIYNFLLEDSINWLQNQISTSLQPFIGYYHFLPPHDPYHTRADFYNAFAKDGYRPPNKPRHVLQENHSTQKLLAWRQEYDEYILYVDSEFARLFNFMEEQGFLDNTWLVLTSDHGEMFERGIRGHRTKVLHQPVIHIPLLIFPPGERSRVDIYDVTSAIDVLPTLTHVTGNNIPDWTEGTILSPFSNKVQTTERDVFSIQVEGLDKSNHITKATVSMIRKPYKLMYYFGYDELGESKELVELYDIVADPEELNNLFDTEKDVTNELLSVLKKKLEEVR